MNSPHINALREHLMETLAALRDRDNPMEPDRARAIAQVASVLVDTAKVEVDYLKATGQDNSNFIDGMKAPAVTAAIGEGRSDGRNDGRNDGRSDGKGEGPKTQWRFPAVAA